MHDPSVDGSAPTTLSRKNFLSHPLTSFVSNRFHPTSEQKHSGERGANKKKPTDDTPMGSTVHRAGTATTEPTSPQTEVASTKMSCIPSERQTSRG